MKFVKERVNVICQELARLSISQKIKITDMQVKNGCYITPAEADASEEPWTSFDTVNDRWYGPDKHYWFRTTITVPESFDGKNLWMRVHAGLDDWDDGRNPQFLLFANGEVIQGMDINHREVLVRENAKAGEKIQLDLQSYTGTLHSEFRLLADLEEHDAKIEEIYYDLIVPMQGLNRMDEDNKTRLDLETALTNTINLLDLRKPYSKEFYASIEEAEKCIQEEIYEKMGGWDEVVATCIGHTHIDVAWLWTIDQVRQKSCRSFATVLKLMEEYPNYHFMSSQPKLYSFVKERHPEVYEKIPQVEALSDEIAATMAQAARKILAGDRAAADQLKKDAEFLKEQKAVYLKQNGYPANYLELQYVCPDCKDTGYADGKKCHCFKHMEIEILYDQSNIREVLERENFDTLSMAYYDRNHVDEKTGMTVYDYMSRVIRECKEYVENFKNEKGSILFTGNTGCGKTFLSNCIARELIRRYFSVVYLTATDMFDILAGSRFNGGDDDEAKDRASYILDCDLLIIDDLGTELINTFTASQMFYCVNERLNRNKGTIISTNLTLGELQDAFTERVTSRIMSRYKIIPLIGDDIRLVRRGFMRRG